MQPASQTDITSVGEGLLMIAPVVQTLLATGNMLMQFTIIFHSRSSLQGKTDIYYKTWISLGPLGKVNYLALESC